MTAVPSETAMSPGSPSPSPRQRIRRRVVIPACVILVLIAFVLAACMARRQLSAKERLLLGAWEWQGVKPGAMVLCFDDRGILTYSQPPYIAFHFERWYIDEHDRIHFTADGKDIFRTVRRLVAPKTEVYRLRFSNGSPILTMTDGTEEKSWLKLPFNPTRRGGGTRGTSSTSRVKRLNQHPPGNLRLHPHPVLLQ